MSIIRLLIVDDHTLFRQGVRTLISAENDMEVAGEAADAAEAVALVPQLEPDVVLMDIGMPGLSSFDAARQIRKEGPESRVIFLSMYDDEDYVAECVEIGAAGYVLKDCPADQLLTAIREVSRGGNFLSPRLLARLVEGFRMTGRGPERQRLGGLTKREREILKMLAEGRSVKEIAAGFDLSVKTVEAHKFNLMRKLDIHNKAQLVQYAIQKKIIRLHEPAFI
ncbi:MAG TPA: response regulator transcription factor [Bryobacteraceae bacterium]|jgi:DNA-binding NarL/FixJ family response regulator|nr:response regulator transcription factor [Bryobacteraceae bacterium]